MPHRRGFEEAGTDETEGHMPRVKVPDHAVEESTEPAGTEVEDTEGHALRAGKVQPVGEDDEDTEGHRRHLRS